MNVTRALRSCLVVLALVAAPLGCAHEVTVRSEPAGADVYLVDDFAETGTLLGPAPVTFEVENGLIGGGATVVVHDGDTAVQVDITRGRVTPESFSSALADSGTQFLCCGGVAAGLGALSFWLWPLVPVLAWPSAFCAGCAGLAAAFQPLGCACSMWAPPDIVDVNLRTATASSQPGEMVGEVQRVDGPPPLAPPDDDEGGAPHDDARPRDERPKPPLSEGGAIEILYRPGVAY